MDVSVIILNYNTLQLTRDCIKSILKFTDGIEYEVIIIDNASIDGSVEALNNEFPGIKLLPNKENLGFGRGNNVGINKAKGKYLLLLNSDTVLLNNAIKIFFDFMETNNINNSIGVIGCLLFDINLKVSRSSSDLPTLKKIFKDTIKGYFSRFVLRRPTSFVQELFPNDSSFMEVGFVVGADMFIPSQVLSEVGLFDPNLFMYFEETDLQKRIRDKGFKIILIKGPQIIHYEGQSNKSIKKYILFYKSMFYYIRKHKLYMPLLGK